MDPISVRDFKELIQYRQPLRTKTSKGQVIETFVDFRKALVKITESGNEERQEGERMNLPGTLTIAGHYDSDIDTLFRITWNAIEYNITAITPAQNRRFMVVTATKVFE